MQLFYYKRKYRNYKEIILNLKKIIKTIRTLNEININVIFFKISHFLMIIMILQLTM